MSTSTLTQPLAQFLGKFRENCGHAAVMIRLMWRACPGLITVVLLLAALQAVLSPVELFLFKEVIDSTSLTLGLSANTDQLAARLPLMAWILIAAAVLTLGRIIQPASNTIQSVIGDRLTSHLKEQVIRTTGSWKGLARFEDPAFADDLHISRQSAAGGIDLITMVADVALGLLTSVAFVLTLVGLHPLAPVLIVLVSVPHMLKWWNYNERVRINVYTRTPEARRLAYNREAMLTPDPAKDVRLYSLGGFFLSRYDRSYDVVINQIDRLRRRLSLPIGAFAALSGLAVGLVYAYTVQQVASGALTLGAVVLYGGAATMLQGRLLDISLNLGSLPMFFGYILPLSRVLDTRPDLPLSDCPVKAPRLIQRGITFENVHFTYPGTDVQVLKGVSLELRPQESLALVGHNGAGKTTIVKLLLRLYDPTEGRIILDGVDLREYDLEELRSRMGVIFQDFVRYELTARENIGLGQVERMDDESRLVEAASKGGATELLNNLPEGPDTQLGTMFGGRELSGGEWQKLALSRAFFRDSQLLVLDEPTAALDMQTEYEVYTRFHELTQDRMTLLISHRFSTVRMADRIVYLEDGRVSEEGTHEELMRLNGEYARLYNLQASQYLGKEAEL